MNAHIETPNGAASISFEAQSILQSHEDIMELFYGSKNSKLDSDMK